MIINNVSKSFDRKHLFSLSEFTIMSEPKKRFIIYNTANIEFAGRITNFLNHFGQYHFFHITSNGQHNHSLLPLQKSDVLQNYWSSSFKILCTLVKPGDVVYIGHVSTEFLKFLKSYSHFSTIDCTFLSDTRSVPLEFIKTCHLVRPDHVLRFMLKPDCSLSEILKWIDKDVARQSEFDIVTRNINFTSQLTKSWFQDWINGSIHTDVFLKLKWNKDVAHEMYLEHSVYPKLRDPPDLGPPYFKLPPRSRSLTCVSRYSKFADLINNFWYNLEFKNCNEPCALSIQLESEMFEFFPILWGGRFQLSNRLKIRAALSLIFFCHFESGTNYQKLLTASVAFIQKRLDLGLKLNFKHLKFDQVLILTKYFPFITQNQSFKDKLFYKQFLKCVSFPLTNPQGVILKPLFTECAPYHATVTWLKGKSTTFSIFKQYNNFNLSLEELKSWKSFVLRVMKQQKTHIWPCYFCGNLLNLLDCRNKKLCTSNFCLAFSHTDCISRDWLKGFHPGCLIPDTTCPACETSKLGSVHLVPELKSKDLYYYQCKICHEAVHSENDLNTSQFVCSKEECQKMKSEITCPYCHHGVEKIYGCNHITCVCGGEFCYGCSRSKPFCSFVNTLFGGCIR